MKRATTILSMFIILSLGMFTNSCEKNAEGCVDGTWDTLDDCISAKIANGVDDECNCETDNWPDGPWYMVPDN